MRVVRWTIMLFASLALLVLGFYFGAMATTPRTVRILETPEVNSLFTFKILEERYDILFEQERVLFQPFETSGVNGFVAFTLTQEAYPKLFEQSRTKSNFYTAKVVSEKSKPLIEVSTNYHDHGSYSPAYTLVVDPTNGNITVKE